MGCYIMILTLVVLCLLWLQFCFCVFCVLLYYDINISCDVFAMVTGLFLCATMWPLLLVFYLTKAEPIVWPQVPWPLLCIAASLVFGKSHDHTSSTKFKLSNFHC